MLSGWRGFWIPVNVCAGALFCVVWGVVCNPENEVFPAPGVVVLCAFELGYTIRPAIDDATFDAAGAGAGAGAFTS